MIVSGTQTVVSGGGVTIDSGGTFTIDVTPATGLTCGSFTVPNASLSGDANTTIGGTATMVGTYLQVGNMVEATFRIAQSGYNVTLAANQTCEITFPASAIVARTGGNFAASTDAIGVASLIGEVGFPNTIPTSAWVSAVSGSTNLKLSMRNTGAALATGAWGTMIYSLS